MSGISRRLPDNERNRLKSILKNLIPEQAGVIIRTAAEGASETDLEADVSRLKVQWEDIDKQANNSATSAPSLLYSEPDLTVRVIRDIFNEDFNKMLVQGDQAWDDIQNYIGHIAPELASKIEKWTGPRDLFAENRVEEQLAKAFDRKVYLPSGGSLVIDRTEAMIVIDINTGKFIGKGGNLEETVTKNNLEAAEEIARQLRLRDMGGIIVIDFIDMTLESNRELVLRRLVECLGRDRTKHQVAEVTSLGLVQMTRKRVGQGLIEAFSTTCESCGGRGIHIHSEPVKKVALEKDMDQRFVKSNKASQDDDADEQADSDDDSTDDDIDTDQNLNSNQVDEPIEQPPVAPGRRKGRRAVSTGVISTS
jgi:Rne/Rng family ribonuclease